MTGVNIHMILQVLSQSKFLSANLTREPAVRVVSDKMPPKAVLVSVCPSTVLIGTLISVLMFDKNVVVCKRLGL